jgi:hypothetical protein
MEGFNFKFDLFLIYSLYSFLGASRNDPYSLCKKFGIAQMAEEIGLKAWEYGENLQDGYQKVDVRKNDKEPLKLAEEYAEKSER